MENRIKRTVVIFAVLFIGALLITLILNLVRAGELSARQRRLEAEYERLQAIYSDNQADIDYYSSEDYVRRYAHENGMKGKDETIYKGK